MLHYLELNGADISMPSGMDAIFKNFIGPHNITPLMAATNTWNVRIVEYLTDRMADPTVKDSYGFTAKDKAKIRNLNTIYNILDNYEKVYHDKAKQELQKKKLEEERKWLKYD